MANIVIGSHGRSAFDGDVGIEHATGPNNNIRFHIAEGANHHVIRELSSRIDVREVVNLRHFAVRTSTA